MIDFVGKPEHIAQHLTARIRDGEFKVGDLLPTTLDLCGEYDAAKATVTKALALLGERGLVASRRGVGCRVASITARIPGMPREIGFYLPTAYEDRKSIAQLGEIWSDITSGIAATVARAGYRLAIIPRLGDSASETIRRSGFANVIFDGGNRPLFEEFIRSGLVNQIRYVMINRAADFSTVNCVDEAGLETLTSMFRRLAAMNYRRIALVGIDLDYVEYTRVFPAHKKAMCEIGEYSPSLVFRLNEGAPDAEYDAVVRAIRAAERKPDLIVIYRNRFLDGMLCALEAAGIRVPADLPLITVDCNLGPEFIRKGRRISAFSLPSKREFGVAAGKLFLKMVEEGGPGPFQAELPLSPVHGETCFFPQS